MNRYEQKARGFLHEFKAFALKGNVIDLAVAVVIGTAFNKIVSSLVDSIVMPLVSILTGEVDLSDRVVTIAGAAVKYGAFLQAVIDFLLIALSIFVAIKIVRSLERKEEAKPEQEKVVEPPEEVKLLREIRDTLVRGTTEASHD
jgi:large conductance mechanosensitive channel